MKPTEPGDESGTPDFEGVPDDASCAECQYSELLPMGPELNRQRVCRRFPPAVFAIVQIQGGQTVGFSVSSSPTPVDERTWCYEYDPREGPDLEPTGLILGLPSPGGTD